MIDAGLEDLPIVDGKVAVAFDEEEGQRLQVRRPKPETNAPHGLELGFRGCGAVQLEMVRPGFRGEFDARAVVRQHEEHTGCDDSDQFRRIQGEEPNPWHSIVKHVSPHV